MHAMRPHIRQALAPFQIRTTTTSLSAQRRFASSKLAPKTATESASINNSLYPKRSPRSYGAFLAFTAFSGIGFFAAGHIFFHYFYEGDFAYGISMLPTLSAFGNYVIISKYYRRGRDVVVGDVVSFKHPVREGEYAVKRVMGMEGDFVLMNSPGKSDAMLQVPKGHCWVVGDDIPHSRDSRAFGPLPMALISGKIIAKIDLESWSIFSPSTWWSCCSWIENGLKAAPEDDTDD